MEDNVILNIDGVQRDADGEENRIELFTVGRYYRRGGVHFVTYKETEVSGMEGAMTVLKIYPGRVALLRLGRFRQKQEFVSGESNRSIYATPYGELDMSVFTTELKVDVADTRHASEGRDLLIRISVKYELEIDGRWQSANTLSITIQGDKRKHGH